MEKGIGEQRTSLEVGVGMVSERGRFRMRFEEWWGASKDSRVVVYRYWLKTSSLQAPRLGYPGKIPRIDIVRRQPSRLHFPPNQTPPKHEILSGEEYTTRASSGTTNQPSPTRNPLTTLRVSLSPRMATASTSAPAPLALTQDDIDIERILNAEASLVNREEEVRVLSLSSMRERTD